MCDGKLCPVCRLSMDEIRLESEVVDRCPRCCGLYFDRGELEALVDLVRTFRDVTLDETDIDTIPQAERDRILYCPVDGAPMREHDIGGGFIIDICERCEAIWLDDGELNAIKRLERHIAENITLYLRLGQ